MSFARIALAILALAVLQRVAIGQEQPADCPTALTTFLTMLAGQDDPPDQRERFEFRDCPGRGIQLQAFERGHASPMLVSEIFSFPVFLFQSRNVLAFQSPGGSADHVYIFAFRGGHPQLIAQTSTKGQMQVRVDANGNAVIEVPISHGHDQTEVKRYVVRLESRSPNNPSGK